MMKSQQKYRVACGTSVLVSDEHMQLHCHIMLAGRLFHPNSRVISVISGTKGLVFESPDGSCRSPAELADMHLWVFETGHPKWPYLIIQSRHLYKDKHCKDTVVDDMIRRCRRSTIEISDELKKVP